MAVLTYSPLEVLARMAEEIGLLYSKRITTGGTNTLTCPSITNTADTYKYGVIRVQGKGTRTVTGQTTGGVITLSAALSAAAVAGETADFCFWLEQQYGMALNALKAGITASFPYWHREVLIDANHNTLADGTTYTRLTLNKATDTYALPTDVAVLSRVVIQPVTGEQVKPIPPLDLWRVQGQEGALSIKFYQGIGYDYLPSKYDGETLGFHYMAREPMFTDMTTSAIQIPMEALATLAARLYKRRNLFREDSSVIRNESVAIPSLDAAAQEAWARVGFLKPLLPGGEEWMLR